MSAKLSTSQTSPDSLPIRGYTFDQLKSYIQRTLGDPVWNVEITPQQIIDSITDALSKVSLYRPRILFGSIQLSKSVFAYLEDRLNQADIIGVARVDFVDLVPAPTEIFYGNLISPAPVIRTGLDEYDTFLRWRKTWQRVTSVAPDWLHDEERQVLYIYNPIERYHAGVEIHGIHVNTTTLDVTSADWVRKYALAQARYRYGELLSKFNGAIPAPLGDLTLDQNKRAEATKQIEELDEKLHRMQLLVAPQID